MGFFKELFGKREKRRPVAEAHELEVRTEAADWGDDLVEVNVVGESYRQDVLASIAGPKEPEGKSMQVGATLRCEPSNQYDDCAVRVEVMGQLVGYIQREFAAELSPAMQRGCRGVIEARGLIVGGWRDGRSEGHYGIRAWVRTSEVERIGLSMATFQPPEVERGPRLPDVPAPRDGERRLSPPPDEYLATVTVTGEEHYQAVILATRPAGWDRDYWQVVCALDLIDANPHTTRAAPCVRVSIGADPVDYLTPKMTERYTELVRAAIGAGESPTAVAWTKLGKKKASEFWELTLVMPKVGD